MDSPSLASIFFGPLSRLFRLRRQERKQRHTRPAIQFQPLEPRFLLSADLVGTVHWDPGAGALFPDADAEATVVVQNIGDRSAKQVKVSLYASADDMLDAADILVGTDQTRGKLRPGAAQEVEIDLDLGTDLRPGDYRLLALVDSRDKVDESDESNNVALGPVFDFAWKFGDLPGCAGSDALTFRDADGTKVTLQLDGPGVGELTWDGSGWDLLLTGTDGRSGLSILTNHGGDGRFEIDDIHVAGALEALFAPKTDLKGTLALDGRLGEGLVIGSATDAIIAVPTIGKWKDHGHGHDKHDHGGLDFGVEGIAVLGDFENSQILIGADLGADGQPGGEGDDADQFGSGKLGNLLIAGSMLSSAVRVGQDPVDGIFDNGDDVLEDGSIRTITILGEMSDDSRVVAGDLPRYAFVDRHFVKTAADPRFIDELGDEISPTVIIDQALGQVDPTGDSPILFAVVFSEEVFGFGAEDISFAGSTVGGTLAASVSGSGAAYTVSVSGMSSSGLVSASIVAGAATDGAGNASFASTSTDNTVTFLTDTVSPSVTIDQALGQADPTGDSPILFAVVFSEEVFGFGAEDISFAGSTVGGTLAASVSGSGAAYTVSVSGMSSSGLVSASIVAGAAADAAGNASLASTSMDNMVTFHVNAAPVAVDDAATTAEDTTVTVAVLANDTDVENDALEVFSFSQGMNGGVVLNPDGTLTYTPAADFFGTDSFTYVASDGQDESEAATVTITINAVNDDPVALDDSYSVDEDGTLTVSAPGVLGNDSDVDNATLLASVLNTPAHGALSFNGDGSFTYTPHLNFNGADSFTYQVTDGSGGADEGTVLLTVHAVNDAPVGTVPGTQTVTEDTPLLLTGANRLNVADVDATSLTVNLSVTAGTLTLGGIAGLTFSAGDGTTDGMMAFSGAIASIQTALTTVTYNPVSNSTVPATLTLAVSDNGQSGAGGTLTDSDNVTILINGVNDAPLVSGPAAVSTNEDTPRTFTGTNVISVSDVDATGGAIFTATLSVTNGTAAVSPTTGLTFVGGANGTATMTFTGGLSNLNSALAGLSYTPGLNFNGAAQLVVSVNDGGSSGSGGLQAGSLIVPIMVHAVNDAPVGTVPGTQTVTEDTPLLLTGANRLNVADVDATSLTVNLSVTAGTLTLGGIAGLTFSAGDGTTDGMMAFSGAIASIQTALTTVTYNPVSNSTVPATLTLAVSDNGQSGAGGTLTDSDNVTILINAVNDDPVALDDSYSVDEDGTLAVSAPGVLGNDSDVDNATLLASVLNTPAHGALSFNGDGSFTYTPHLNFNGSDSFTYQVTDSSGGADEGTVLLTVHAVNDAPVAVDDSYSVDEDGTLTVSAPGVLSNDTDVENNELEVFSFSQGMNGGVVLNPDGTLTYTPAADFFGTDSFTYVASDGQDESEAATVTITINAVNDDPVAGDDVLSTAEDMVLLISKAGLLVNDTDVDGDLLTIESFTQAAHGAVVDNGDGTYTYTPNQDFHGEDSFSYTAADGAGGTGTATVTIRVTPVNDAPVALDDSFTVNEDGTLTVSAPGVLGNDSDVDSATLTAVLVSGPMSGVLGLNSDGSFSYTPNADFQGSDSFTYRANDGALDSELATVTLTVNTDNDAPVAMADSYSVDEDNTITVTAPGVLSNDSDVEGDLLTAALVSGPAHGVLTLNSDGSFSYTPGVNFHGSDSFTYVANDGELDSAIATVSLTVHAVNDDPVAGDDALSTAEDMVLLISGAGLLANDTDVDGDALTIASFTQAGHGAVVDNGDGTFSYTPELNFNGPDSFEYTVGDGHGGTDTATVTITVTPVNDAPVAVDDSYSVDEDGTLTVSAPGVLSNDTDVENNELEVFSFNQGMNGGVVLNPDGTLTYTPAADFFGTDSFTYVASDGQDESEAATVTITINAVNDDPVALDDSYSVDEDGTLTVSVPAGVLGNDSDVDNATLLASVLNTPAHGALSFNGDGSFTYTPHLNFNGTDSFTYQVTDGSGGADEGTVLLTVHAVNDAPVLAAIGNQMVAEGTTLTFDADATDVDVPANTLTFSLDGAPIGAFINPATGLFTWMPDFDQAGDHTFNVVVTDDGNPARSDSETVTVTVSDSQRVIFWDVDASGLWSDAANWSGDIVPTAEDIVVIDRTDIEITVTVSGDAFEAFSLYAAENLTITGAAASLLVTDGVLATPGVQVAVVTGGTLVVGAGADSMIDSLAISGGGTVNVNGAATVGNLSLTGGGGSGNVGGLGGSGAVTLAVGGTHDWNSGLLSGSGELIVAAGATLTVDGGDHFANGKPIVNEGTVNWTAGRIDLTGDSTFANEGVFELAAGSTMGNVFAPNGTMVLTNTGLMRQQQAETTTFGSGMTVHNQGAVEILAGQVNFGGGGGTHTGSFDAAAGATLGFTDGNHQFDTGSSVTVAGTLAVSRSSVSVPVTVVNLDTEANLSGAIVVSGQDPVATLAPVSGSILPTSITVSGGTLNLTPPDAVMAPTQVTISGGGTVNLNGATTVGNLSLTGGGSSGNVGGLGGSGAVTLAAGGTHDWNSGLLSGSGELIVAEGATLTVDGGDHFANGKPIVNQGTVNWTAGRIDLTGDSTFANEGVFELAAGSTLGVVFAPPGTMVLTNTGLIRQQQAETTTFGIGMTVHNQGTVEILAGQVNFGGGGGTHTGSFDAAAGATLGFTDGNHQFDTGSSVTVAGTLAVSRSSVSVPVTVVNLDTEANLSGAIVVSGQDPVATLAPVSGSILPTSITVSGGTLNLTPPDAVMAPTQVTISGGGTVNLNGATTVGNLSLTGGGSSGNVGGLGGSGAVTLAAGGTHDWNSGLLSGSGELIVAEGATLTVDGGDHFANGKPIVNQGTVNWTAGRIDLTGDSTFANEGVFELAAGSTLGVVFAPPGTMVLTNTGLIRQQQAETTTFGIGMTVHNEVSGLIDVQAGIVSVTGTFVQDGTVEVGTGATLRRTGGFTSSGMLAGNGTIDVGAGNVLTSTGTVAPGSTSGDTTGTLTIAGNYTQGADGLLGIELGSVAAGGFDALAVSGTVTIAGAADLSVVLVDGFVPDFGDRFRFMTFASRSGYFGAADLPPDFVVDLADATDLELVYLPNVAPVAADDEFSATEDTLLTVTVDLGVLGNDTDANGDPLSALLASAPPAAQGVVTLAGDGSFTFMPAADFNGTTSFTYRASDGELESAVATVTITVNAVNDDPVVTDDLIATPEDSPITVPVASLLGNDLDVDGDALTVVSVQNPTNGTVVLDVVLGEITYTPDLNFNGSGSFTYTVSDGHGGSDTGSVNVDVGPVNDAPVLDAIADMIWLRNMPLSLQMSATDADDAAADLTFALVGTVPTGATITVDGLFQWTPSAFGTFPVTVQVTDVGGLHDEETFDITVVAPPRIAIDDAIVLEPDAGQSAIAVFRVMLSGPAPVPVTVGYGVTTNQGATDNVDYDAASGTLTFAPGETEKTFERAIYGDGLTENDERFAFDLFNPINAVLSSKVQGFGIIVDDESALHLAIGRRTVMEGDSGDTTAMVFDVLLSSASGSDVTVDYATIPGSALAGLDYGAASSTLTFLAGEMAKTFTVTIVADAEAEGDEQFTVALSNPNGATITPAAVTVDAYIVEDDGPGLMTASVVGGGEAAGAAPDAAQLEATLDAAVTLWAQALGADDARLAQLAGLTIGVADFSGAELGTLAGATILIDADAAGHGWFVDLTPADSSEFRMRLDAGVRAAAPASDAFGRMDLLTVVMHEIGHVLGFDHEDASRYAVMRDELDAGVRYTTSAPKFGLDAPAAGKSRAHVAWDDWGGDWAPAHKPRGGLLARSFSDFLFRR